MKVSTVMNEIRRIRDDGSLRHVDMSAEALSAELDEAKAKFEELHKKSVPVVKK